MLNKKELFQVVDLLSSEYGWNIEYIQNLNTEEINNLVQCINERKIVEWKVYTYLINCAMAGKMPKFGEAQIATKEETSEEEDYNGEIKCF
jgi:hypothetical protein